MKLLPLFFILLGALPARAITTVINSTPNLAIPDNNSVGVADFVSVSSTIGFIQSIEVTLNITGGFNGDYYVYLQHDSGFSVLLNRPGKTASNPFGYADGGAFVTISQAALNGDIHAYQNITNPAGGQLTGTWQPDGRNIDPLNVLDTTPRTATLQNFIGLGAAGNWTLFVADRSAGGVGTLTSWSATITGAIPETGTASLLFICAVICVGRRNKIRV